MKKLLAVLLAMVMVLSLFAGCNNKSSSKKKNNDDDDDDKVKGSVSTSATDDTGSTGSTESTGGTEGTGNSATEGTEGTEDTGNSPTEGTGVTPPDNKVDQTEKEFDTGSVKTNKYTNDFVGISLELGAEWKFLTDAEIEERNKQALGILGGNYEEQLKNANTFTDMAVYHSNQTDNISVVFEKLPASYANLTEEQYVNLTKDALKSGLETMGCTNVVLTTGKAQFAGQEHAYIAVSCQINGVPFYERMAIVRCQEYVVVITAASAQTNLTKNMLDAFKAI